jgi:hypothetical protein
VSTEEETQRGIRTIRDAENVLEEIAGSSPTSGCVEMAVRELGTERLIYESDVVGKVLGAQVPNSAKELILGGNLRRLLTPVPRTKGYRI